MPKKSVRLVFPAGIPFLITTVLLLTGALSRLEHSLADARARILPTQVQSDYLIVGIDAKSLRQLDGWPWPRSYFAKVIDTVTQAGAKRVFVDVDFSTVSQESEDEQLEAALSRLGPERLVLPMFWQYAGNGRSAEVLITQPLDLPLPAAPKNNF